MKATKGQREGTKKNHDKVKSIISENKIKSVRHKGGYISKCLTNDAYKENVNKEKRIQKEIIKTEETQKEVKLTYPTGSVSQTHLKRIIEYTKKCGECNNIDKSQSYYHTLLLRYLELIIENYNDGCCYFNASKLITLPIFNNVCHRAAEIFASEPTLLLINSETPNEIFLVLSDLHGCVEVLIYNLHYHYCIPKNKIIILGDYVDKGPDDAFMCFLLFLLKICWPDKIFLLKGNHEIRDMNRQKKFPDNCGKLFGDPNTFYVYNFVFERMPLAAIWNNTVYLAHGGISQWLTSRDDITSIKRPLKLNRTFKLRLLITDILWSDPYRKCYNKNDHFSKYFCPSKRGCGFAYSREGLEIIMKYLNVSMIVRGHQTSSEGFVEEYKDICYTVHSKPSSYLTTKGSACQLSLDNNGNASIKPLKYKLIIDKNIIITALKKLKTLWKDSKISPYIFKSICTYCCDKEDYVNELACQERILVTHAQIMMWMSNYKIKSIMEMILETKFDKKCKNPNKILSRFPIYFDFCVSPKIGTSIRPINVINNKEKEIISIILKNIDKIDNKNLINSNPKLSVDTLPFLSLNQSNDRRKRHQNFTSDDDEDGEETFDEKDDSEEEEV
ncbi:Serine/threonine-protein phosphatase 5 [Strongyloides ratti]|uniref:Serine/threonine-protein phosphatase n=1 Tax=Strongyloides ratti TaxID=34506 RepID=A0A090LGE8_STRRB|nr:Serine/threonine-protein phosphatase 5 [Strongyloides ratti]CEF66600.1 Serine/threonine-protein phosphatase 5 [Strongyloides ratti]